MGSRTSTILRKNVMIINFAQSHVRIKFRSVFCAPSQKFKILTIPNVLAHWKLFKILAIPNVLAQAMLYEHFS
ncbi:hypothetical protein B296_00055302 [Ensete ventricosum]|uniref:Uncharacterized protein n=1 Tax=Ensete ventricosum TaxID=4639 RepID=A0A426Y049_ENSVE|nr:hypothetical protein B296_00055302 [Ensete ventricosum]